MISAKTGEVCTVSGIYRCFGHTGIRINILEGELFPHCPEDKKHEAIWILVKRI